MLPKKRVLLLGSGPDAERIKKYQPSLIREAFDDLVAINNAWLLTDLWTYHIHPDDFPEDRRPVSISPEQSLVTSKDYVPIQNRYGGFVYAGGTMAFTAGYWALGALQPKLMAFLGCDMVYPSSGKTHFYGKGTADPLRQDPTLQNLEAKATRLLQCALIDSCLCLNLSSLPDSRLTFPRFDISKISALDIDDEIQALRQKSKSGLCQQAQSEERRLSYFVESGEYWKHQDHFDTESLRNIDELWQSSLS